MILVPDELLLSIFSRLPYSSLLRVSAVCRSWRAIILGDLCLCKRIFKVATDAEETTCCDLPSMTDTQFHPAISRITYCIGEGLDSVQLVFNDLSLRLVDHGVSQDFACIPSVTEIHGSILPTPHKRDSLPWTWSITFSTNNPDGVRVVDIFSSMVLASTKKHGMWSILSNGPLSQRLQSYQAPALFTKAEILGESKYFAGFSRISRKVRSVSVVVQTAASVASALAMREIGSSDE